MKRGYRTIAPAHLDSDQNRTRKDDDESGPPIARRKRTNVLTACNNCRASKLACDGERPACMRCKKQRKTCKYVAANKEQVLDSAHRHEIEEVTSSLKQHADIIHKLRTAPEPEATAILMRIRSTRDVSAVLSAIRTSMSPTRPSERRTLQAVLPAMDTEIELELVVCHETVYPTLKPIDVFSLELNNLDELSSDLSSPEKGAVALISEQNATPSWINDGTIDPSLLNTAMLSPLDGAPARGSANASGLPLNSHFCDTRLDGLDLRYWTTIPIDNVLAAHAISHYLETDHPINGWFDADLFLKDLTERRLEHCSALLASSLLSLACICYTGFDRRAAPFGLAFVREAEQLWNAERSSNTVTTLAAINILSMATAYIGNDTVSRDLVASARVMAEEMELFGTPHTSLETSISDQWSENRLRATAHVAWGTYCWLSFHATLFRGSPISFPPALPIPGDAKKNVTSELKTPIHHLPGYMGHTFATLCKFWRIIQEILTVYLGGERNPIHQKVCIAFAESKYQKILALADTLDESMAIKEHSRSHVSIFQMLYHISVLDIFRPFMKDKNGQQLMSFTSTDSTPDAIFNASFKQLKRILLDYRMRFQGRNYSGWLNMAAQHVCNLIIRETDDPTWRFYFSLCMGFWKETVVSFPVMMVIAKANLSLALSLGCVTGTEAQRLLEEIERRARHHEKAEVAISAIADFERATVADDEILVNDLGKHFEMLAYFDNIMT